MATAQQPNVDTIVLGALETVAKTKCLQGFHVDKEDKKKFLELIKRQNIKQTSQCAIPLTGDVLKKNGPSQKVQSPDKGNLTDICHGVRLSVQANCSIRVYARKPVKVGAAAGGAVGGAVGGVAGVGGGIAAGALIGSIVPVAGTIVGGVIGGIVGGIGGTFVGGAAGSAGGAGGGAIKSNVNYHTVYARDVFRELPEYCYNKNNNSVQCTVLKNTVSPSGITAADGKKEQNESDCEEKE